jgi:hypothetical protein
MRHARATLRPARAVAAIPASPRARRAAAAARPLSQTVLRLRDTVSTAAAIAGSDGAPPAPSLRLLLYTRAGCPLCQALEVR